MAEFDPGYAWRTPNIILGALLDVARGKRPDRKRRNASAVGHARTTNMTIIINGNAYFRSRKPREILTEVAMDRTAALHASEALTHVAREVFDDEEKSDSKANRLNDAVGAIQEALLKNPTAKTIVVRFSEAEMALMPEALSHVAHEIYDGEGVGCMLQSVSDAVREASPAAPGFR